MTVSDRSPAGVPAPAGTVLELDGRLVVGAGAFLALPLRFVYRTVDPFAVALEFPSGRTRPDGTTWVFSRDLLRDGLARPAGLGDVRVRPPGPGRRHLRIRLRGTDGEALLEVPFRALRTWLVAHSYALVPEGAESRLIDWDSALQDLRSDI